MTGPCFKLTTTTSLLVSSRVRVATSTTSTRSRDNGSQGHLSPCHQSLALASSPHHRQTPATEDKTTGLFIFDTVIYQLILRPKFNHCFDFDNFFTPILLKVLWAVQGYSPLVTETKWSTGNWGTRLTVAEKKLIRYLSLVPPTRSTIRQIALRHLQQMWLLPHAPMEWGTVTSRERKCARWLSRTFNLFLELEIYLAVQLCCLRWCASPQLRQGAKWGWKLDGHLKRNPLMMERGYEVCHMYLQSSNTQRDWRVVLGPFLYFQD